jgi:hypothetical protein
VTNAIHAVFNWAVDCDLVERSAARTFANSLERKYYRSLKKGKGGAAQHGNAKLTPEDEQVLLGFIDAAINSGESMSPAGVRELAGLLFEQDFGEKWYIL